MDDFLIAGKDGSERYAQAEEELRQAFRFGKWQEASEGVEFAGCRVIQKENFEITLDQQEYSEKWLEEIPTDPQRPQGAQLTNGEISQIRGALGTASWRATQTAPQYLADTSLLLSEISR